MIELEDFVNEFNEQLIDNEQLITLDTKFRELDSWDSLTAMAVIVMVDDKYGVKIDDQTFKAMVTIKDMINYINENS